MKPCIFPHLLGFQTDAAGEAVRRAEAEAEEADPGHAWLAACPPSTCGRRREESEERSRRQARTKSSCEVGEGK